jgi:DNA mismatch repair protein MutS2
VHAESVLEFESLRELVGRFVRSPLGRAELDRMAPTSDRRAIENSLADAAEALAYTQACAAPQAAARGSAIRLRFEIPVDPAPLVARLRIEGASLEAKEIFEISRLLDVAAEIRSALLSTSARFARLAAYAEQIADLRSVARELAGKILPDGSLPDDSSVALGKLRRDQERHRRLIEDSLARFLRDHQGDGTLQEDFVTIRNDRFVVPIITGKERRVDGVIHGSSGSGHTVFVEPIETINLNNELVRLHEEELRETHRLLREFTARLRIHSKEIAASVEALGKLELIFAKAEFGIDFRCVVPTIRPDNARRLLLRQARHPLLEDLFRSHAKNVVPVSLALDDQHRTLLISGPNTGGKTVALKTVGLLALMAHAGLPVPAAEAEFPVFDQVLADVGDHQSLAESLSSFSGHIVAVRRMLDQASVNSLVLLDELGRATDPEEGGPLGVVILEEFRRGGSFTLASTHLMAMKVYGASTDGVVNGSMGFDEGTLQPTYVLRLGAPGKSAGLDIASRLGLDRRLIQAARARMSAQERDIAKLLGGLNDQLAAVELERADLAARERSIAERERALEESWQRRYAAKMKELEKQAAELSAKFEQTAQETIEELSQKARARIARTRREYQEAVESLAPAARATEPAAPPRVKIAEGVKVRLRGIRQPATVRRVLSNGLLEVEAGFLKMQVGPADVEEVLPATAAPGRATGIAFRQGPSFDQSYREINLVGQRAEEACSQVDKFLDSAALAAVERVRIVHGHGMGILKKAVADLLKQNPHVAKFYAASPEEGGAGATIVELR